MENIKLIGENIYLRELREEDAEEIFSICDDSRVWEHMPYNLVTMQAVQRFIRTALENKKASKEYPFVIFHKKTNKIIGSTRFMDIAHEHKRLEIGSTWIHPNYWKTAANTECKYLLLSYCFEQLQYQRVQIKTGHENVQSQRAIERIGAKKEGILRNHMIRPNGNIRHTVMYSVIKEEWPETKLHIERLINAYK